MIGSRLIASVSALFLALAAGSCAEEESPDPGTDEAVDSVEGNDAKDAASDESDAGDETDYAQDAEEKPAEAPLNSELVLKKLSEELEKRRYDLDLREREIVQREHLLNNLETAALQKAGELEKLKVEVSAMLGELRGNLASDRAKRVEELREAVGELSEDRKERIAHLVATIKGMRASAGAGLLGSMDKNDAVEVLRALSARQAATFLGALPPDKAAVLAEEMLGPRLPPIASLKESDTDETSNNKE